jgi:hypothetical protein
VNSLAPWLWLVDFDAHGKALDASDAPHGEIAVALMTHFAEVHVLRPDSAQLDALLSTDNLRGLAPASTATGSLRASLWPTQTFDCIALHDALVRRRLPTAEVLAELHGAHKLLKPGGWLALASPRPSRLYRQRVDTVGMPRAILSRLLTEANFREIRCLYVEPSADNPRTVVPDVKSAVGAHNRLEGVRGRAMWKRRAAVQLGFRSALFPAYLLLARA